MMQQKIKIIFIVLCFYLLLNPSGWVYAFTYTSPIYHYSFLLPNDWEEIPKDIIDEVAREIQQQTQTKFIDYLVMFQLSDKEYFQYPYISLKEFSADSPSYSQLSKFISEGDFSEALDKTLDEYASLISDAVIKDPYIDKKRNLLLFNMDADVKEVGTITGLSVMFLGKHSMVQLNFYSEKSEYKKFLPVFNFIIDSFSYDKGYEYNEIAAIKNVSKSIFHISDEALAKVIGAGIAAAFFSIFLKRSKKNDKQGRSKV